MTVFTLRMDLADHEHRGNPQAQAAAVHHLLDKVRQAVGQGSARSGEITTPSFNAAANPPTVHRPIGRWEFTDDARDSAA